MVQPIKKSSIPQLTGKKRYRSITVRECVSFTKVLILQVEETYYMYDWEDRVPPSDTGWKFRWRDATVEDITEGTIV